MRTSSRYNNLIYDITNDLGDLDDDTDADEPFLDDDLDWFAEPSDLVGAFRTGLASEYDDAADEDVAEALTDVLASMSPAESFNFAKGLRQIEKGAARVVADPAFRRVAGTALPVAGGVLGTVFGGPAGTTLASGLGRVAAGPLGHAAARARTPSVGPGGRVTGRPPGEAAAKGFVLAQHPEMLQAVLAGALGEAGRRTINGVPVPSMLSALSSVFGEAAADADALAYADDYQAGDGWGGGLDTDDLSDGSGPVTDPASQAARLLYRDLLEAEDDDLSAAMWP